MEKIIHIHAKCRAFEIFEQVPEKKAVRRLNSIRNNFTHLKKRIQFSDDSLSVKTIVVNPEFNFHPSTSEYFL
jgi:hypothetical protein